MSKIAPLGSRVLIRVYKVEKETSSGIILPENSQDAPPKGEVVSTGDEVESVAIEDVVLYTNQIIDITDEDELLVIVEEDDILAIIEEEK